jgi:hypothetical protein
MPNALKCPNPSCPYLFDPTGVPAGVVLTCPRCGMRFTLGPPAPTTTATNSAPPGYPSPSPPAHDPFATQPEEPDDRPAYGGSGTRETVFWVVATVALLTGVALTIYFTAFRERESAQSESGIRLPPVNLALDPPGPPWERDQAMESKLGGSIQVVYRRASPEAYLAIGAKDFQDRRPRPSELRRGLMRPLRQVIQEESIRLKEPVENAAWLGQPAAIAFTCHALATDGTQVKLECYAVHAKGVAYWWICWAGLADFDAVAPEFDAARGRVRLLKLLDNRTIPDPPVTTFGGHAIPYRILDGEGIWTERPNPETSSHPADLHLLARVKEDGIDQGEADLWVYLIDPAGDDPFKQGREFVETLRRKEMDGRAVTFKERTGAMEGDPPIDTVDTLAAVVRLEASVEGASGQGRLIVVSAIRLDNKVVVVRAECEWKHRETFETKLVQIAGSLRSGR